MSSKSAFILIIEKKEGEEEEKGMEQWSQL
mgnify:CR=1 FL=1